MATLMTQKRKREWPRKFIKTVAHCLRLYLMLFGCRACRELGNNLAAELAAERDALAAERDALAAEKKKSQELKLKLESIEVATQERLNEERKEKERKAKEDEKAADDAKLRQLKEADTPYVIEGDQVLKSISPAGT